MSRLAGAGGIPSAERRAQRGGRALGWLASGLVIFALLGCQAGSDPLVFSDPKPVTLPRFEPLPGAPRVEGLALPLELEAKETRLASGHRWHALGLPPSGRESLTLVALSPEPYLQIRFLAQALRLQRLALAQRLALPCLDTLKISTGLHSVALHLSCPEPLPWGSALEAMLTMLDPAQYRALDLTEALRRQAVLDRIEGAVSGEMDRIWRELLLGEAHPYVRALDEEGAGGEVSARFGDALDRLHRQARWQLITRSDRAASAEMAAALSTQMAALASLSASGSASGPAARPEPLPAVASEVTPATQSPAWAAPVGKIHLIDAPGSVQLQAYIGYRLADASAGSRGNGAEASLACASLAAWLGRSFSGRLFYDLREVRGWTYGIHGYCTDAPLATLLTFSGSTRLEHSGAFLAGVLDHLAQAGSAPPPEAELTALQRYAVSRARVATADEAAALSDYLARLAYPRPPLAPWLLAQDGEALRATAASHFAGPPVILLRGDAKRIREDLQAKLPDWPIVMVAR